MVMVCISYFEFSKFFILVWLYCSHKIRFAKGYDRDLESDYQGFIEQYRKGER